MKKIFGALSVFAIAILVLSLAGCTKEITYKVKLTCRYTETGIDTGDVIPNCIVKIGKDDYAEFAKKEGITDANGVFECEFQYEALLDVNVSYHDTITDTWYVGIGQIKLLPNELVDETILLMRQ